MKLSVNILTWNTIDTLLKTLDVLKVDLKDVSHETLVVDNNSTDGCREFAAIKNDANMGTAFGKNQGIRASSGEYILLLDGDVVPVLNSVPMMIDFLDENPIADSIGFCRNKYYTEESRVEKICHELHNPREYNYICLYYGMFRRDVFDHILLDENYDGEGYGWEDRDFWEQFNRAGFKQYVADLNHPGGRYYHRINSSIRVMGHSKMMETSKARHDYFRSKWRTGQNVS